jgi:hypothetical protein
MGNPPNPNPYWSKALQNQQRNQAKPQGRPQSQGKVQVKEGFDSDLLGKDVEVEQVKGQNVVVIKGKIEEVSKYWLRLLVNGESLYLNKAFIISIKPLEMKDGQGGPNAGEQSFKAR